MKIVLIGYGKMGKAIEKIAIDRGHQIVKAFDQGAAEELSALAQIDADVAIEFSQPEAAFENIKAAIDKKIPVISGTTGWLDHYSEIREYCTQKNGTFLYASNFSLGVNLFFKVNEYLAKLMTHHEKYTASIEEIHHIHKKDAPSGTAISLAEGIIGSHSQYGSWALNASSDPNVIPIIAHREAEVAGTHSVKYSSAMDEIEITHTAHTRKSFAEGAVLVAEWIRDKKGVLTMDDFLKLNE